MPPEQPICHISAEIVSQIAKEFDIENFATEEKMMLDNFTTDSTNNPTIADPVLIDSSGPVTAAMEIEIQKESVKCKYINNLTLCYYYVILRFEFILCNN